MLREINNKFSVVARERIIKQLSQEFVSDLQDIKLADIKGNVIAKTTAGDIYIDNIDGRVASETLGGSVLNSEQVTR